MIKLGLYVLFQVFGLWTLVLLVSVPSPSVAAIDSAACSHIRTSLASAREEAEKLRLKISRLAYQDQAQDARTRLKKLEWKILRFSGSPACK
ncbi:MAG: hypothetical protein D6719_05760 [Candidatus Dadabacteria bacterium]|nr:MAG: hypothetical protein D6719_05760 [Candidatus Dadabacteria bacterium]